MKKPALITIIICLLGVYAHAQRKIQYGFSIGGGLGIQSISNDDITLDNSIRTFNMDASVSIPVLKNYFLRTGVGFENKGSLIAEDALTTTTKITYIELPVTIAQKFEIPTLGKLVVGAGGYAAMGLTGKFIYETPSSNNSNNIDFGPGNDLLRFDAGLRAHAGLELNNRLTFTTAYDFGLYNIASQALIDAGYTKDYNRQFTIKLGVIF